MILWEKKGMLKMNIAEIVSKRLRKGMDHLR